MLGALLPQPVNQPIPVLPQRRDLQPRPVKLRLHCLHLLLDIIDFDHEQHVLLLEDLRLALVRIHFSVIDALGLLQGLVLGAYEQDLFLAVVQVCLLLLYLLV
jgi:hypothetical protein